MSDADVTGEVTEAVEGAAAAVTEEAATGTDPIAADTVEGPEVIGQRTGMFGISGSGDTSGYGGLATTVTLPGEASRPFGGPRTAAGETGEFDEVAESLAAALELAGISFREGIEKVVVDRGELTFVVRREHLLTVAAQLRDRPELRFEICTGVSGIHYPEAAGRELRAVYPLLSYTHNRRIRLEVTVPDADPHLPSTVSIWPTSNWHERETFDFFGLVFDGHPGLTRILMPDDWPGHPQRKDYPLGGIPVEYKGATIAPPDERRGYAG
jgi:NADH-quinone oxidoreductase subunit C